MNIYTQFAGFRRKLIALAALAAFNPAYAEDEAPDIAQLSKPSSSVSIGLGATSGNSRDRRDRAQFGTYNGLRKDNVHGLFDFEYVKRDDVTGTWLNMEGRNLGLDNRELRFSHQRQGDWKYFLEYTELVRRNPYSINTGMVGGGSPTPTIVRLGTPGTGADLDLKLKRENIGLGGEKWITPNLMFEVNFKNEEKDGARVLGRGFNCPSAAAPAPVCTAMAAGANAWALLLLPEPINSTTRQLDAKLTFSGDKLTMSGGYYGSFYTNHNSTLTATVPGVLNDQLGNPAAVNAGLRGILQLPLALPPDNQAHQFFLSGTYGFTSTTRATFKYGYTHATQNRDFASMGLIGAPAGVANLGGMLNTNLFQLGLTSRPLPKLSLLANVRVEDRKDKTPDALYNVEGVNTYAQSQISLKKLAGKLEGSYQLPDNYRVTVGADYESLERGLFAQPDSVGGLSGLRQKTEEIGYRAELRRLMSETFSGAISYGHSRRDGSVWLKPNTLPATGATPTSDAAIFNRTAIFPFIFMNRNRDKVKFLADWSPLNALSLQFAVEDAVDRYDAPTTKGLRNTKSRLYSVDASYTLSERWKLNGYVTRGDQYVHVDHGNFGYIAELRDINTSLGFGINGKPVDRFEVGATLSFINDVNRYGQQQDAGTGAPAAANLGNGALLAATGGLPDVTFRQTRLKLFGKYTLDKKSDIRVDFVHQRTRLNEWTWGYNGVPFLYSDNTTVSQNPTQNVTFVGVTYIYKF